MNTCKYLLKNYTNNLNLSYFYLQVYVPIKFDYYKSSISDILFFNDL